jgi:hypothetical protein
MGDIRENEDIPKLFANRDGNNPRQSHPGRAPQARWITD